MGSARVTNTKASDPTMETDKKSFKPLTKLIKLFTKKKEKQKHDKNEIEPQNFKKEHEIKKDVKPPPKAEDTMAAVLKTFENITLNARKTNPEKDEEKFEKFAKKFVEEQVGEEDNAETGHDNIEEVFSYKIIDEPRNERINSHSSEDSGYSDSKDAETIEKLDNIEDGTENDDKCDDLAKDLKKLDLNEQKKSKKLQTVYISRPPVRNKVRSNEAYPYPVQDVDNFRTANKNTLSGGQVIVNQSVPQDNISELNIALENAQKNSQYLQNDKDAYLTDLLEYINEDTIKKVQESLASEYTEENPEIYVTQEKTHDLFQFYQETSCNITQMQAQIPRNDPSISQTYDELTTDTIQKENISWMMDYVQKEINTIPDDTYIQNQDFQVPNGYTNTFPTPPYSDSTYLTPPRSDIIPSPMTLSPGSFYPSNSEHSFSPERSPISNSEELERFVEINQLEEGSEGSVIQSRTRTESVSSMTLKQYKDLQKEIAASFSKKDCCQSHRKSCKELFQEHMQKLKMVERKNLCIKVAKLDLKTAYGVLHHILLSLSRGSEQEDLEVALFRLVCERILGQDGALFVGDAGLNLLKSAALRCPDRPLLTRYIVQCVRTALNADKSLAAGKESVFHEVDALGDTLVIACARAGDPCADVLYEIVRSESGQPPLFKLTHSNADGHTALHVACSQHSAAATRLHTVHVLLEHARLSVTHGDLKGEDTALHLAVYSANCDLKLILLIFKQAERKEWKSLAHWNNRSSKTPIDLARMAMKSTTRQNYPPEVLEFLKKCR